MAGVEIHDVIAVSNKEKSSGRVQSEAANIRAARVPFRNHFFGSHINCDGRSGPFDVGVKKSASIIDGIAFAQTIQLNFRFPFQMTRIGSVENLENLSRLSIAARNRSCCDPNLFRCRYVKHTVRCDAVIRRNWHTFAATQVALVDPTKRRVAAIADVNSAVADTGCGWAECDFASASLNFASLKSRDLRYCVRFFIDHHHAPEIAGWHPYFSSRRVVSEIIERDSSVGARKRDWFQFVTRTRRVGRD